jgi:phosphatidylserine/phosphatidylglycerophosphate/cardiolipin synthase-like enzyme
VYHLWYEPGQVMSSMARRCIVSLILLLPVLAWATDVIPGIEAQVYFSPRGGCTDAIVTEVSAAKAAIFVQAYSFTSPPIAKALAAAKERGIDVRVILDKSQRTERYSGADFIAHAGIPVLIDEKPAIAHSKVMIIDATTVITGSFNFTMSAEERNVENVLVLRSATLAALYAKNWQDRAAVSVVYIPKDQRPP